MGSNGEGFEWIKFAGELSFHSPACRFFYMDHLYVIEYKQRVDGSWVGNQT